MVARYSSLDHTRQGNDQLCLAVKFIGTIYLLSQIKIYWYHRYQRKVDSTNYNFSSCKDNENYGSGDSPLFFVF